MTLTRINLLGIDNYLEVSEEVVVPINFSIADIRDVQAKSGSYSKSIKIIGTKHNNEVLNHLFDVNAVSLTYNLNVKQPCQIVQNDELILDNAILQLVNVEKISNGMNDDEQVVYTVTVKDTVGDLFTDIGNAMLTDLDFSDLNHSYTSANVVASWAHDVTDGYKYILPMSSDNIYQLPELKPAIYLKTYLDRIFSNAGYQYQFDEAVSIGFNKLLMPYNGDKVTLSDSYIDEVKIIAENTTSTDYVYNDQLIIDTEIQDTNSAYNPATSTYTSEYALNVPNSIQFRFTVDYDILLDNTDFSTISCSQDGVYNPSIIIEGNGNSTATIDTISFVVGDNLPSGVNVIASGVKTISGVTSNINIGDLVTFSIDGFGSPPLWDFGYNILPTVRINSIRMEIFPSADTIAFSFPIVMNQYVPVQIKQSDFIKSIFTMFNIFCQPDETDPTKIVLKTRDRFYDTGVVKNWSKKLVKDKPHVIAFLPEVTAKTLTLTYAQDKDVLNAGYLQNISEIYGQVKYVFDNEYIKNDDKKTLIFGASPFIDTSFGAIVMGINGTEPKTLPRIVYDGGNYPCGTFYIYDYGTTGTACTSYPYTTHFDKPLNPDLDFNFGICDYYFSQSYQNTTLNNLSTLYWRRTMSQINGGKLYIVYLNLNPHDIANLKLNDKIYLDRSYWNINKVIDYDANSNEPTKVELLSIDDELVLPKIRRKIDAKPNNSSSLIKPFISDVLGEINNSLTINASTGNIVLNGKGNIIDSVVSNAVVIGDNQVVTKNGITTNVANVNENFANADLTFTDNRTHDLDSNIMILRNGVIGFDATGILTSTGYSFVSDNNVGTLDTTMVIENTAGGGALTVNNGNVRLIATPTYADEAAATTAGLLNGTIYKTPTGELRIKL
jgi:hypothetical protein